MSATAQSTAETAVPDRLRPVRVWLYVVAGLVLAMVLVGGATRLTDSGLSITSWKPISGIVPPLTPADWWAEFQAYQAIPEYQLVNKGMTLDEFKAIFWWEWGHRALGRLIGAAFFVPFLVFLVQRRLSWRLAPMLALLFVLGGLQGALGWWMVTSGLVDRVDVSQYRLAAHLAAACALLLALVYVARRIRPPAPPTAESGRWPLWVGAFAALVFAQIVAGAFVAGLDAGFGWNTWPLMDGGLLPDGFASLEPWWRNLFENHAAVQFNHRMLGYLVGVAAIALGIAGWRAGKAWGPLIAALTLVQIGLGVATLLLVVPVHLALAHQGTAFVLAAAAVAWIEDLTHPAVT